MTTRLEFVASILDNLITVRHMPLVMINRLAPDLWRGYAPVDERKYENLMKLLGLDDRQRAEFRWHFVGGG